jgi:hypothetical protein
MSNATQDRNTPHRAGALVSDPVAAATKLFAGTMYGLDASGNAIKAGAVGAGPARAVAQATADNSAGAAGDVRVEGKRGVYRFGNSASGDLIARADIGALCYVVDDQTVAKTDDTGAREIAGVIVDVDSAGVWVDVGSYSITVNEA